MFLFVNLEFMFQLFVGEILFALYLSRRKYFWIRFCVGAVICFIVAFLIPIELVSIWFFFLMVAITVIFWFVCLEVNVIHCVFVAIAGFSLQHLSSKAIQIVKLIFSDIFLMPISLPYDYLIRCLVRIPIYIAGYFLFAKKLKGINMNFSHRSFLLVATIDMFFTIILSAKIVPKEFDAALGLYVYAVISCLLSLFLLFNMVIRKNLEDKISIIEKIQEEERKQYYITKETMDYINVKCHDLKYHICELRKGTANNERLREIENAISIYDSIIKTGSEPLDVLLAEKCHFYEKNRITLSYIIDGKKLSFIDDADIYSLFGNILDNAAEAVMKLPEESRRIFLSVKLNGELLIVHIENKYEGEIRIKDGLPVTTKNDQSNHGYGMRSISMCVERYGGIMNFSALDGLFSLNILFPLLG